MKRPQRVAIGVTAAVLLAAINASAARADVLTPAIAAVGGVTTPVVGTAKPLTVTLSPGDASAALASLNPGTSEEELRDDAAALAAELGLTPQQVLDQQLAEAQESVAAAGATDDGAIVAASSGGGNVPLGDAANKGDIFVSPASTLFVQHGHTGIYYTAKVIVEAPGAGKKSMYASASGKTVGKGTVKQHMSASQANRDKAANYAYNNMRGKDYNANFAFNRSVPAKTYNCSQLVWGAYKAATGIDLDSNGGFGVYPYNIRDSSKTVTYKTL